MQHLLQAPERFVERERHLHLPVQLFVCGFQFERRCVAPLGIEPFGFCALELCGVGDVCRGRVELALVVDARALGERQHMR
jgi:hypothetical protein